MSDQARQDASELPPQAGLPDSTTHANAERSSVPSESMGHQLARRRQELGWTVEHVASRLNLAPRQIDALESDNLTALPGLASTRGFVRAYAKLLRMDSAPLVSALSQEAGPQEEGIPLRRPISSTPFAPAKLAPMNRGSSGRKLWAWLALGLVVLVLAGAWRAGVFDAALDGIVMRGDSSPAQPAASAGASAAMPASSAPAAAAAGGSEGQSTSASGGASGAAPASASTPGQPANETASTVNAMPDPNAAAAPAAAATAAPAAPAAQPAAAPAATPATAAPSRALVIKAKEECWIDIRRAGKSVTRTLQPGAVETIDVGAGVTVVLGNALGVDVSLDGKPIDVRSKARNNVTRLDLKSS